MLLKKSIYNKSRKNKRKKKQKNKSRKMYGRGADKYYLLTTLNKNNQFDTYIISKEDASKYLFQENSDIMNKTDINRIEYYYKDEIKEYGLESERTFKPTFEGIINNIEYGKKINLETVETPFTINPDNKILLTSDRVKNRLQDMFFIVWIWTIYNNNNNSYSFEEWSTYNPNDNKLYSIKLKRYYMKYVNKDIIKPLGTENTTPISITDNLTTLYLSIQREKDKLKTIEIIYDPIIPVDTVLPVDPVKDKEEEISYFDRFR